MSKVILVILGLLGVGAGAWLHTRKDATKYESFWAGVLCMVGALFMCSTPMQEGATYTIHHGQPHKIA